MPVNIQITPGYNFADGEQLTEAKLRAIAAPTGQIEDGSVTGAALDTPSVSAALGLGGAGKPNYFANGNLAWWTLGAGPFICSALMDTPVTREWFVRPAVGTVTAQQSTTVTTAVANQDNIKSLYSLELTGTALTTGVVEAGQNIEAVNGPILGQPLGVSFYLYNGTAAAFAPNINFYTAGAPDVWTAPALLATVAGGNCPSGAWTRVTAAINGTGWAGLANGLRVTVALPAGTMQGAGVQVLLGQLKLELAGVTPFAPEPESAIPPTWFENALTNGNFADDYWAASTPITCAAAVDGYNAQAWFCNPTGGTATYQQTATGLAGIDWGAQVQGAAGCTSVDFGQNVRRNVAGLCARKMTFSCLFWNGTGATVTPALRIDTTNTLNAFAAANLANQVNQALQPCASGSWTELTWTLDATAMVNIANGMRIYLRTPVTNGQTIKVARGKFEPGGTATRAPICTNEPPRTVILAASKNLVMAMTNPAGWISVGFDELIMKDLQGNAVLVKSVAGAVINSMDVGAFPSNVGGTTMGYIWGFWDGNTFSGKFSLSATAPTVPNGCTHSALLGGVPFWWGGGSVIPGFIQNGNKAFVTPFPLYTGAGFLANQQIALAGIVPPMAKTISGLAGVYTTGANVVYALLTDTAGSAGDLVLGVQAATTYIADGFSGKNVYGSVPWTLPNAANLNWRTSDTTVNKVIQLTGWEF